MPNMPSEKILDKMENMLNVASDSTRLKIMYSLSLGEKNVGPGSRSCIPSLWGRRAWGRS